MKRILLVAALLAGTVCAAYADRDTYNDVTGHNRSDTLLHADVDVCTQQIGPQRNGVPTSARFKRCMRGRGWKFERTTVEKTWIDPETGLRCHDILVFGIVGSSCSNF